MRRTWMMIGALVATAASATPAAASEWRLLGVVGGIAHYLDLSTVERRGDETDVYMLRIFAEPGADGHTRSMDLNIVNCGARTYSILIATFFRGSEISRSGPGPQDRPIVQGSLADIMAQAVCEGRDPGQAVDDPLTDAPVRFRN